MPIGLFLSISLHQFLSKDLLKHSFASIQRTIHSHIASVHFYVLSFHSFFFYFFPPSFSSVLLWLSRVNPIIRATIFQSEPIHQILSPITILLWLTSISSSAAYHCQISRDRFALFCPNSWSRREMFWKKVLNDLNNLL